MTDPAKATRSRLRPSTKLRWIAPHVRELPSLTELTLISCGFFDCN